MPSIHQIDETRSRPSERINSIRGQSRQSHVSISSTKRPSMNPTTNPHPNQVKQGMFHRAVPQMPRALAFLCFLFNLVLPGTGKTHRSIFSVVEFRSSLSSFSLSL